MYMDNATFAVYLGGLIVMGIMFTFMLFRPEEHK